MAWALEVQISPLMYLIAFSCLRRVPTNVLHTAAKLPQHELVIECYLGVPAEVTRPSGAWSAMRRSWRADRWRDRSEELVDSDGEANAMRTEGLTGVLAAICGGR